MLWAWAYRNAKRAEELLTPHCEEIAIVGSVRRQKSECKDVEIVCIPKPFDTGLFESGIVTVLNQWKCVKGHPPCKYTQRILPSEVVLDLFFAVRENYGIIKTLRTGSSDFNINKVVTAVKRAGYTLSDGFLWADGKKIPVPDEHSFFTRIGLDWVEPKDRK